MYEPWFGTQYLVKLLRSVPMLLWPQVAEYGMESYKLGMKLLVELFSIEILYIWYTNEDT